MQNAPSEGVVILGGSDWSLTEHVSIVYKAFCRRKCSESVSFACVARYALAFCAYYSVRGH
jgi:hypothetical protein